MSYVISSQVHLIVTQKLHFMLLRSLKSANANILHLMKPPSLAGVNTSPKQSHITFIRSVTIQTMFVANGHN